MFSTLQFSLRRGAACSQLTSETGDQARDSLSASRAASPAEKAPWRDTSRIWARIIDADRVGHELIEPGQPAYQEILERFGNDILDSSGHIDRKKLGPQVFADPQQLQALNAIVHPRIVERADELASGYYAAIPKRW